MIFAGIPALVIVLIAGAVYAGGARHNRRYRPGRPFEFTPVWFLSAPEKLTRATTDRELTASHRAELTSGTPIALAGEPGSGDWSGEKAQPHAVGGASDRW